MELDTWLARADWRHRGPELGSLRAASDERGDPIAVMDFEPPGALASAVWASTRRLWHSLPAIPNVVDAMADGAGPLALRYAAIDWRRRPRKVKRDALAAAQLAAWGIELTQTFEILAARVPNPELGWLTCPLIKLDLRGQPRVLFLPAATASSRVDGPALVHVIGRALSRQLASDKRIVARPLASIIARCLAPDPAARFRTLQELRDELTTARGGALLPRRFTEERAWRETEAGLGLLALKRPDLAVARFEAAYRIDPTALDPAQARSRAYAMGPPPDDPYTRLQPIAAHGQLRRAIAEHERLGLANPPAPGLQQARPMPDRPRVELAWADARAAGAQREAARDFDGALTIYDRVRRDRADGAALDLAIARCSLHLGRSRAAAAHADAVLQADPADEPALAIRTKALLLDQQPAAALACADRWIAVAPGHELAHYMRGRCLFVLGRLDDARRSLEHASALQPRFLPAQLLRREVDRHARRVRATAGRQADIELPIPEHLAELRVVLVEGRVDAAIELLLRVEHAADPVAGLLLARCLAFTDRFAEAVPIFDRVARASDDHRHAALVGKAEALLALDRAGDALAIFDAACAARPEDADASEGRARALSQLGRSAEAEAELRRCGSVLGVQSERRVQVMRGVSSNAGKPTR